MSKFQRDRGGSRLSNSSGRRALRQRPERPSSGSLASKNNASISRRVRDSPGRREMSWRSVARRGSGEHTRLACGVRRLAEQGFPAGMPEIGTRGHVRSPDPLRAATISEAGFNSLVPVDDPLWRERVLQLSSQLRGNTVAPATRRDHRIIIEQAAGARASLYSDHAVARFVMLKTLQTPLFTDFARGRKLNKFSCRIQLS